MLRAYTRLYVQGSLLGVLEEYMQLWRLNSCRPSSSTAHCPLYCLPGSDSSLNPCTMLFPEHCWAQPWGCLALMENPDILFMMQEAHLWVLVLNHQPYWPKITSGAFFLSPECNLDKIYVGVPFILHLSVPYNFFSIFLNTCMN